MTAAPDPLPPPRHDHTSVVLRAMLAGLPGDSVPVEHVVRELRRRSFGGLLLPLAALALLPGVSLFAGLLIFIPGFQMAAGYQVPRLPRFVRERTIDAAKLRAAGMSALPWIERAERYLRPRWLVLTAAPALMIFGVVVVGLALVLLLPLPFSNFPPAVALVCLSLGFLERDGVMVALGLVLAAIALALGGLMLYVAVESVGLFLATPVG